MKKILKTLLIVGVLLGVVTGLTAFKMNDSHTYVEQTQTHSVITIKNTTPLQLSNITISCDNEKKMVVDVIEPGKSVAVEIPPDVKPIIKLEVTGSAQNSMNFAGAFTGMIDNDTYMMIYLDEDMNLGINSNMIDE